MYCEYAEMMKQQIGELHVGSNRWDVRGRQYRRRRSCSWRTTK